MKKKITIGDIFTINTFTNGDKTLARVLEIKGRIFKKYVCAVWGESSDGHHLWPNGSVSTFTNTLSKRELAEPTKD